MSEAEPPPQELRNRKKGFSQGRARAAKRGKNFLASIFLDHKFLPKNFFILDGFLFYDMLGERGKEQSRKIAAATDGRRVPVAGCGRLTEKLIIGGDGQRVIFALGVPAVPLMLRLPSLPVARAG